MDLKDFIKSAISSISQGIAEAQEELKENGVLVNPEHITMKADNKTLDSFGSRYVEELSFEVHVGINEEVTDGIVGKAGAGLKVLFSASIEGDHKTKANSTQTNVLRFKIPVAFPYTPIPESYKKKAGGIKTTLPARRESDFWPARHNNLG